MARTCKALPFLYDEPAHRFAARGGAGREVYVPSGQIRGEEMSICGKSVCDEFERLWFDIIFIGVSDIALDGLYDYSP